MRQARLAVATLALLAAAVPAAADWPAGGKQVTLTWDSTNGTNMVRFLDLPSGDIAVISVGVGGLNLGYSLQRVTPLGDLATGWPVNGLGLGEVSTLYSPAQNGFAVDDSGCVWHAGYGMIPNRPSAQLARPDGGDPSDGLGLVRNHDQSVCPIHGRMRRARRCVRRLGCAHPAAHALGNGRVGMAGHRSGAGHRRL